MADRPTGGWNLPSPVTPKPWSKKAKAGLVLAGAAVAGAGLFLPGVLTATIVAHEIQNLADNRDQSVAETIRRLETRKPWVSDFRADPVWGSPEWAAIAVATDESELRFHREATDGLRKEIDSTILFQRGILRRALDHLEPRLMGTTAPLDDHTAASIPFMHAVIHAQKACDSGDPAGYIAGAELGLLTYTENDHELLRAWDESAPLLVSTAALHACGNT